MYPVVGESLVVMVALKPVVALGEVAGDVRLITTPVGPVVSMLQLDGLATVALPTASFSVTVNVQVPSGKPLALIGVAIETAEALVSDPVPAQSSV